MSEINKEILDNEEITVSNENNEQVDITSDQIINLENIDNDISKRIETMSSDVNNQDSEVKENYDMASNDLVSAFEMENPTKISEDNQIVENSTNTSNIENKDANFMPEVMNPISHTNDQYTLINVLKNFNNGELEYFEEMKQVAFNKKELIHIYPRMFFWKKRKAKKINDEIILEMETEFQNNYQNVLSMRNDYKAKFNEYEHRQRIYKESLFKL